ncbi:MAG: CoA transferase, partial [Pseudomonadota bacterium]|nr:CoA transferase [Pseudomonadota bacterium]
MRSGPLVGVRVLELEAIGPAPFAAMMLADMGADVLRVDRAEPGDLGLGVPRRFDTMLRGRRSLRLDLKRTEAGAALLDLASRADVLIEGFRPGVMERLGLGPEVALARNPALIYGRMTGWGQSGPLAAQAGHDIDYIALSGALHAMGRAGSAPPPPLNLVGDFGGGGLLLAFGIVCALNERQRSGAGQVVDAAMVEGASLLTTMFSGLRAAGLWRDERGSNSLDSGAPWYDSYETADGGYVAVGALEGRFYAALLRGLELDPAALPDRSEHARWPELRRVFASRFRQRSRDEWCRVFADSDACVAPVLTFAEAPRHAQAVARQSFVSLDGIEQPAAAPRLSRTPGAAQEPPP